MSDHAVDVRMPEQQAAIGALEAHSRMMAAVRTLRPDQLPGGTGPEGLQLYVAVPGVIHLQRHRQDIEDALKETTTR